MSHAGGLGRPLPFARDLDLLPSIDAAVLLVVGTVGSPPKGVKTGTGNPGDFRTQVAEISQASAEGLLTAPFIACVGDFRQLRAPGSRAASRAA